MTVAFGLVGTGHWAGLVHARAAITSDDVRFTTVYGRSPQAVRERAREWNVTGVTDFDRLLDEVDVVGFAVPPDVQADLAIRAAAAGKSLLLEKPIALDLAGARALQAEAHDRGVATRVFLTQRYLPEIDQWIGETTDRGGWRYASVDAFSSVLVDRANPFHTSGWRHRDGALWDAAPHALSLLCPVLGPVVAASAVAGVADLVVVTLTHATGAVSTLSVSHSMPHDAAGGSFTIVGDTGRSTPPIIDEWDTRAVEAYRAALSELTTSTPTKGSVACDIDFGVHIVAVLEAAATSIATGRSEPV